MGFGFSGFSNKEFGSLGTKPESSLVCNDPSDSVSSSSSLSCIERETLVSALIAARSSASPSLKQAQTVEFSGRGA